MGSGGDVIGFPIYLALTAGLIILAIYIGFLPAIVAFQRHVRDRWFILALNILLGGTGIGWIVALIWAYRASTSDEQTGGDRRNAAGLGLFMQDIRALPVFHQPWAEPLRPPTGSAHTTEQVADAIERLSELMAHGYLSADEFRKLKERIITR